jgi:hypothetical protein
MNKNLEKSYKNKEKRGRKLGGVCDRMRVTGVIHGLLACHIHDFLMSAKFRNYVCGWF